jgi:hypothetical protein
VESESAVASWGRSSAWQILRKPDSAHSNPEAIQRETMSSFSFHRFTWPVASRQLRKTFSIKLVLRNVVFSVEGTPQAMEGQQGL